MFYSQLCFTFFLLPLNYPADCNLSGSYLLLIKKFHEFYWLWFHLYDYCSINNKKILFFFGFIDSITPFVNRLDLYFPSSFIQTHTPLISLRVRCINSIGRHEYCESYLDVYQHILIQLLFFVMVDIWWLLAIQMDAESVRPSNLLNQMKVRILRACLPLRPFNSVEMLILIDFWFRTNWKSFFNKQFFGCSTNFSFVNGSQNDIFVRVNWDAL